jgi:hypothetical protein
MQRNPAHPRLSFLLASEAPVGVVFRRGPSKMVQVVMWNRTNDTFKPGQWFRGRIHTDRSDISPDGRHLIYFAIGGVAWAIPATRGTWTAISKLPGLRATALWGQGDTWGGGGVFTSNRSFWLDVGTNAFLIRDHSGLRRETRKPAHVRREQEKTLREGWILRRVGWPRRYELEQPGECKLEFPNWECADWDRHRLVWAEAGRLCAATLGTHKLGSVHTLFDFDRADAAPECNA